MKFTDKLKLVICMPINKIRQIIYKKPEVMTDEQTVQYIVENKCSVARFGDGELDLMMGIGIKFQKADKRLAIRLKEIAGTAAQRKTNNCLVCIPDVFFKEQLKVKMVESSANWWKKFMFFTKGFWNKNFTGGYYGDTNISRFYMEVADKERTADYVKKLKSVWENANIVFVEGEKSRLGVGNDLFSNAASVKRIICPSANAFDKYGEILEKVKQLTSNDDLIICALGPTATVLSYDLANCGRRALDLGHIDVEYEWFKMGATEKVSIAGKDVSESKNDLRDNKTQSTDNVIAKIS